MDVLNIAMQMETEGCEFYTRLANRPDQKHLKGIFVFLADEEIKHKQIFLAMSENQEELPAGDSEILTYARKVFESMAGDFSFPDVLEDSENAYSKALEMEKKSIAFYTDLLDKDDVDERGSAIRRIIAEEQSHVRLLENLMDFVRSPKEWLENSEFNHLDDY